ncbi:MAG: hypothetical protein DMF53_17090 [Acidobacteria bacterium]|nr:MAG: hypothetical protein DMF53_17090 [Acidobacteriota bacterium]
MEDRPAAQLGELLEYLGPGLLGRKHCPPWPPDVFALTASVLRRTGAYVRVLDLPPRDDMDFLGREWPAQAKRLAHQWRQSLNATLSQPSFSEPEDLSPVKVPAELDAAWRVVRRLRDYPVGAILEKEELCRALLLLCLVADEASAGIGVNVLDEDQDEFLEYAASEVLTQKNGLTSLCLQIDPEKMRVLPKQHTSQRGITVRSLSHHLALCPASDVEILWHGPFAAFGNQDPDVLNLLLIPWPLELTPKDFQLCAPAGLSALAEPYRFFSFQRKTGNHSTAPVQSFLDTALKKSLEFVDRVDGIVFPELALTWKEYRAAERMAIEKNALLIAGVNGQPGDGELKHPTNACFVQPGGLTNLGQNAKKLYDHLRIRQCKHHRWCLDRNQIIQYGLGGVLPASKNCWEHTKIDYRYLNFVTLGHWLTLSVLICEDLARQDPVAEILRSVGPTLVIALLMDGPQLRSRWPSRYASVLADDPGCSVLTLTSLGMATCSRLPKSSKEEDRSRTIALWRDICYGEREIELPERHNACVLSLVCESFEEFSADSRGDGKESHFPVFAGLHTFEVDAKTLASGGIPTLS